MGNIVGMLVGVIVVGAIYYYILTRLKDIPVEERKIQSFQFAVIWGIIYMGLRLVFKW